MGLVVERGRQVVDDVSEADRHVPPEELGDLGDRSGLDLPIHARVGLVEPSDGDLRIGWVVTDHEWAQGQRALDLVGVPVELIAPTS